MKSKTGIKNNFDKKYYKWKVNLVLTKIHLVKTAFHKISEYLSNQRQSHYKINDQGNPTGTALGRGTFAA